MDVSSGRGIPEAECVWTDVLGRRLSRIFPAGVG